VVLRVQPRAGEALTCRAGPFSPLGSFVALTLAVAWLL